MPLVNAKHLPTRADVVALLRLATPLVAIQVGMMLMGVVDTIMVGRVSATALAAVALGNIYFFWVAVFGMGVLLALDPIVAQALGARDELAVRRGVQRGLVLSLALTVPITALLFTVRPVLELVGQPVEVIPDAAGYVYRSALAVWPFYAYIVLRQTLVAHHRTLPIMATIVIANVVNAALNYVWIFGKLGFPALGVLGSAWATVLSRWLMVAMLLAFAWRSLRPYLRHIAPDVLAPLPLWRMLKLGAPIGMQMGLEGGAFYAVALMMGSLGVAQVAAHQVAVNLASLTFMVPLGVSSAAAVIVGNAIGRGDMGAVRRSTIAALGVGGAFMLLMAVLLVGAREVLAGLYTRDVAVLSLAALLLPIAGVFQVADGLQVVAIGVLRGLGDTRVPMILNIVGFWLIGIPISLWLGFALNLGAVGLWWGLVAGLVIVAVLLILRVRQHERRDIRRVLIDDRGKRAAPASEN